MSVARQLAHKILADYDAPQAGDRTRSAVDPDVRRSKHGAFYDGYLLDILMDADSELVTQINVLPANGDEARDAAELVRREHPKVERKLSEILVRHDGRHARYGSLPKVFCQELLTTFATNVKRIVRLVCAPHPAPATN